MNREDIRWLVAHCTGWPLEKCSSASFVHHHHIYVNKWAGIGYNKFIQPDGTVEEGRPWYWRGAHVRGHNHEALGAVLAGRGPKDFTDEQYQSLWETFQQWREMFPRAKVVGHCDLDDTKEYCPGFNVKSWWYEVNT